MARSLIDHRSPGGSGLVADALEAGEGVVPAPCAEDHREETRRLFVDVLQKSRIAAGQRPALRPVFLKPHGVARGRLSLNPDIPDRFRHGILAARELRAWVRFSSDTVPTTPDSANSTLGIALKLFGVAGPTLDTDDPIASTADLLLQNHDRFFVDTAADFCAFSHAILVTDSFDQYVEAHPETARVLDEMAKAETSALTATYWSVLPYACGPAAIVKYRLVSREVPKPAQLPDARDPNRLALDLAARLSTGKAVFDLEVQPFVSEAETPTDKATVRWTQAFVRLGSLVIEQQDVNELGQSTYGENLSFDPWRVPDANRPLGSLAASRRIAYRSAAFVRRHANGVPIVEPRQPR